MRSKEGRGDGLVFIVDFGGVVIKWKNNNPIFDYVALRYGIPRLEMRQVFEEALPELEVGQVSMREFLERALGRFGKRLRQSDSPDELWTVPFETRVRFRAGMVRLVESLRRRGFKVYMFSNTSAPHAELIRKRGWDELFDRFIASCDIGSMKPDRLAFAKALEIAGAKASQVVFVDDKEENVLGAKEFGLRWAFRFTTLAKLEEDISGILSKG